MIPIGSTLDPIDMILVASLLGTGAIRIDPETEFRGRGLNDQPETVRICIDNPVRNIGCLEW
jgi:hypothetical protein